MYCHKGVMKTVKFVIYFADKVWDWKTFQPCFYCVHTINSIRCKKIRIFQWWNKIQPGFRESRYWFIFFNSALNPFIYGYNNQTMQKAFRITFTCIFKDKVDMGVSLCQNLPIAKYFFKNTVPNNNYRFWADLLHKWSFLGYDWQPWIYPKCHAYLLY